MLDNHVDSPVTLARLEATPCWPYLDGYTAWLDRRRYSRALIQLYLFGIPPLGSWLSKHKLPMTDFDQHTLEAYRRYREANGALRHRNGKIKAAFLGAQRLHEYLRVIGVVRAMPKPVVHSLLLGFMQWMTTHRGVRAATLQGYAPVVEKFLDRLGEEPACYTAKLVRRFVLDEAARGSIAAVKVTTTSVRGFLRYLSATGQCDSALLGAVPAIADWRLASLPRYITSEDVRRLIASCDGMRLTGRRDRSVLLLLWRLAVRAGDVADLRLTDVDWRSGRIRFAGKNRREIWLPLPQDVGDAIVDYLQNERPATDSAFVFAKSVAPAGRINAAVVSSIVRRAIERVGIETPSCGAHLLRHSAATAMLRQGASLPQIGSLLRHERIETTWIYAKVDRELLNQVAVPWPTANSSKNPDHADSSIGSFAATTGGES
jgi:site-specific recombinase XerD